MKRQELIIRLQQMLEIYKDNGGVNASMCELARVCEILIELVKDKGNIGFNLEDVQLPPDHDD